MAITTMSGAISGIKRTVDVTKGVTGTLTSGVPQSLFYNIGNPPAAAAPTPGIGGAVLTSYAGQIPFDNPSSGSTYLGRFQAQAAQPGTLLLCDRLWHNSGITITSTAEQTFTASAQIPARDDNGSANGVGVLAAVEVSSNTGTGAPTLTLKYDNQAGVEKTATNPIATINSAVTGRFFPIGLASGDTGIQKAKSLTLNATWTSGTIHVVLYRVIARLDLKRAGVTYGADALTLGFPKMYDNSVPFLVFMGSTTTTTAICSSLVYCQG